MTRPSKWNWSACSKTIRTRRSRPAEVVDHIEYVADVAGAAHVGLGSDYDGVDATHESASKTSRVIQRSRLSCYGAAGRSEIFRGVLGNNALRVLAANDQMTGKILESGRRSRDTRLMSLSLKSRVSHLESLESRVSYPRHLADDHVQDSAMAEVVDFDGSVTASDRRELDRRPVGLRRREPPPDCRGVKVSSTSIENTSVPSRPSWSALSRLPRTSGAGHPSSRDSIGEFARNSRRSQL